LVQKNSKEKACQALALLIKPEGNHTTKLEKVLTRSGGFATTTFHIEISIRKS
jgi:hypothetical protein